MGMLQNIKSITWAHSAAIKSKKRAGLATPDFNV